jgi:hypothetical protein
LNPEGQKFCGECGEPLGEGPPLGEPESEDVRLPAPPAESRSNRLAVVIAAAVLGVALVAGGLYFATRDGDEVAPTSDATGTPAIELDTTRFEVAYSTCGVTSTYIEVADQGTSIIMDGPSDKSAELGAFITDALCVLDALGIPDYVTHQIENTTSLMGLQDAEWDGIHAQWSYHPDNGLDVILTDNSWLTGYPNVRADARRIVWVTRA